MAATLTDYSHVGARTALCHEWLTTYGGSEVVAATIAESLGISDVYSFAVESDLAGALFPHSTVKSISRIGSTRLGRRSWAWLLPLMGPAWRRLDLSTYEAVITSAHACVNSIEPPPDVPVISYCHTPMRYAWEWRSEIGRIPKPLRPAWPSIAHGLQKQDQRRARNVTTFVANSSHVADRIAQYYGREATVVYPPIDTTFWSPDHRPRERFYLAAGRLVPYKRVDKVIAAAARSGTQLVVAGSGPELPRLKRLAGPSVAFEERPSNERLRELYRSTRALVFAGIEDFGMTLVEAQACGAPVLALAKGGALESVRHQETGVLFEEPDATSLDRLLDSFEPSETMSQAAVRNAARFETVRFVTGFGEVLRNTLGNR